MDCTVCLLGLGASVKAGFPPSPFPTLTCNNHLTKYGYYLTGLQFIYSLAIFAFHLFLGWLSVLMGQPRTIKCSDFVARLLNREKKNQLLAVLLSAQFNLLLSFVCTCVACGGVGFSQVWTYINKSAGPSVGSDANCTVGIAAGIYGGTWEEYWDGIKTIGIFLMNISKTVFIILANVLFKTMQGKLSFKFL